jgi:NAD+ synthase
MESGGNSSGLESLMEVDCEKLAPRLEGFIRDHMEKLEREGVVLGLSGGVDSAVVAALCKRAVGADRVLALVMPEKYSAESHRRDALELAGLLGVRAELIDITPYLRKFGTYRLLPLGRLPLPGKARDYLTRKAMKFYEGKAGETPFSASLLGFRGKEFASYFRRGNAHYRIKHRVRMVLLYLRAELENRLVVGAANKTEVSIGFFVKHGCDDASDVMPIAGLYKTQVRALARHLGIPAHMIEKPPSPDIIGGITDEEAIGVPYEGLDLILAGLERGLSVPDLAKAVRTGEDRVLYVKGLTVKSEHMRKTYLP